MTIADILNAKGREVTVIARSASIDHALSTLAEHRIGALLVVDEDGAPCGILSERDIVRRLATDGAAILERGVADCMTGKIVSCAPGETVDGALATMTQGRFRHLPVMDDGRLVGLVSIGDVVKKKIEEVERDAQEMKRYIAS